MKMSDMFFYYLNSLQSTPYKNKLEALIFDKDFQLSNEIEVNSIDAEIKILAHQVKIVTNACVENYGFNECIDSLNAFKALGRVAIRKIESNYWGGRILFNDSGTRIFGVILVKRSKKVKYRTPPNWDGSQESLEKYNQNP